MAGITGKKKGGGSGRVAQEAPNTLKSRQVARVIDVISEGEIEGLVNGYKSVYFDDTAAENADGTKNFQGVTYTLRTGEPDQAALPEWRGQEAVVSVGTEVTYSGGPVTRTITDNNVDAVTVQLRIPVLTLQNNENGDLNGNTVTIKWLVATGSPAGTYQTVKTDTIKGKNVSPYIRTYYIDLRSISSTGPYHIRLQRVSTDATETRDQRQTYFESYNKITLAKIKYNDTALMGLKVDAKQFGSRIPTRSYEVKGIKISVPNNYNESTRAYSGVWNGTFKTRYSNNPAWCIYDLVTNKRYGLGDYIEANNLDKYAFYEVAKYCDQLVSKGNTPRTQPNGLTSTSGSANITVTYNNHGLKVGDGVLITGAATGNGVAASSLNNKTHICTAVLSANTFRINAGDSATSSGSFGGSSLSLKLLEPRFVMNTVIQSRQEAFAVLQTMASMFHGMMYMSAGSLVPAVDKARDPVKLVTPANVENGVFTYSGTNLKSRHSVAMVRWNDPANDYRQAVETYEDPELRERFGYRVLEVSAFGCTSRSQARRHAKWVLETEKLAETVVYTAGLDHGDLNPSDIISISDPVYTGTRWGGRVSAVNAGRTTVTIDDNITSEFNLGSHTYTLAVVMSDGSIEERTVASVSTYSGKTRITVSSAFSTDGIETGAMWLCHGEAEERLWQVLNVSQKDDKFDVVAVLHDPAKYAKVDDIGYIDGDDGAYVLPETIGTASGSITNISATEYNYYVGGTLKSRLVLSWQPSSSPLVTKYQVFYANTVGDYGQQSTESNTIEIADIKEGTYSFFVEGASEAGPTGINGTLDDFTVQGKLLPPADPEGLTATGVYGGVTLEWTNPTDADFRFAEIWVSEDNNRANATLLTKVQSDSYTHASGYAVTRYYWVRATDIAGNASGYHPAGETSGVEGLSLDNSTNTDDTNANNQTIGTDFPANPRIGDIFWHSTEFRLYIYNGTQWQPFSIGDGELGNLGGLNYDGGGTYTGDLSATNNPTGSGTSFPSNPVEGQFFFRTDQFKLYIFEDGEWVLFGNAYDNTNQLTDGAGLGNTANWPDITGTGLPEDNATNNPVASGTSFPTSPAPVAGQFFYRTDQLKLYTYNGSAWVVFGNAFDNTNLLTDGANLGNTANWPDVTGTGRPADGATVNRTGTGTSFPTSPTPEAGDFFYRTDEYKLYVYDGSNWGVYANQFTNTNQLTDGANLGQTANWPDVTGTGRPADGATVNRTGSGTTFPTSPTPEDGDFFYRTDQAKMYVYDGSNWVLFSNAFDNTNQLTDGANLGTTATWASVTGTGRPADYATNNPVGSGTSFPTTGVVNGQLFYRTDQYKLYIREGGQWVAYANQFTNTNQLTDGANLGGTATWANVTGAGRPADNATRNANSRGSSFPSNPHVGQLFYHTTQAKLYIREASSWQVYANQFTNTNQLTDGANLGSTAAWSSISSKPAFGSLATANLGSSITVAGGYANINLDGNSLATGANGVSLNQIDGSNVSVSNFGPDLLDGDVSKIAVTRAATTAQRIQYASTAGSDFVFWEGEIPERGGDDTHIPFADLTGTAATTYPSTCFIQIELQMKNPEAGSQTQSQTFSGTYTVGSYGQYTWQFLTASGNKTSLVPAGTSLSHTVSGTTYTNVVASASYNASANQTYIYFQGASTGLSSGTSYTFSTSASTDWAVVGQGGFYSTGANKPSGWAVSGGLSVATANATEVRLVLTRRGSVDGTLLYNYNNYSVYDYAYDVSGELGGLR